MNLESDQSIDFGTTGNDRPYLGAGWGAAGPGFRMMADQESEIWLDHPAAADGYVLEILLNATMAPGTMPALALEAEVRGTIIAPPGQAVAGRLMFHMPAELLAAAGPVRVVLRASKAEAQDYSFRRVSLLRLFRDAAVFRLPGQHGMSVPEAASLAGMELNSLMPQFTSLGYNCELGFVQRRCDAETMSLLRFASMEYPSLLRGLRTGFEGFGQVENLAFNLSAEEVPQYELRDSEYEFFMHTLQYEGQVKESSFLKQQAVWLRFLVRGLLAELARGEKIYVYKRNDLPGIDEILPLHAALNRYGPNTLLWVTESDPENPPGTAELIMPGLIKAYIDRFAPYEDATALSFEIWLELCVKARQLAALKFDTLPAPPPKNGSALDICAHMSEAGDV